MKRANTLFMMIPYHFSAAGALHKAVAKMHQLFELFDTVDFGPLLDE